MEEKVFVMRGNRISEEVRTVVREAEATEFIQQLTRRQPVESPLLPRMGQGPSIVYFGRKPLGGDAISVFFIEKPAGLYTISSNVKTMIKTRHSKLRLEDSSVEELAEPPPEEKADEDDKKEAEAAVDGLDGDDEGEANVDNDENGGLRVTLKKKKKRPVRKDGKDPLMLVWRNLTRAFNLSWPHTVWCVRFINNVFHDLRIMGTATALIENDMDTPMLEFPMNNQYNNGTGNVCLGTGLALNVKAPMAQQVADVHDFMFSSVWNDDLPYPAYEDIGFGNHLRTERTPGGYRYNETYLDCWHRKSAEDKDFWKTLRYRNHPIGSLGTLLKTMYSDTTRSG